jgi:hypothetical protein
MQHFLQGIKGIRGNSMTALSRAQGAFEYLMSYGWAIIVVVVLGIVLYNLGAFNPSQTTVISGFAFLKPFSVQVDSLSPDDARIIAVVQNVGGRDYSISSTTVSSPSSNCSYSLVQVADSLGNVIATTGSFALSAGQDAKLTFRVNGTSCGKAPNSQYDYKFSFSFTDFFGVSQTDFGSVRGWVRDCRMPRDNLLAYYRFSEGSGSVTTDEAGNFNAGLNYSPAWVQGKLGYGLGFNGTSQNGPGVWLGNLSTAL